MTLQDFLEEWHNPSPYVRVQTSGSTGDPKPMLVEKRRMLNSARITCNFLGLRPGDSALLCLPLDYIAGKMMVVRAIERGLRLTAVPPSGHPFGSQGQALGPDQNHAVCPRDPCFVAMVPLQVWNTLQEPEERQHLRQVRHLIIGGGAIDEALAEQLSSFPNAVWSTYGMTETLSHIALRRLSGPEATEWYTPFESVSVSLSADGCLVIDAPEVCAERLVTRDIAELSADGRFRILGRQDNVICSGGIKIQAEEVERRLKAYLSEPYLISRRADAKFGEVAVLLTEGATEAARAACERALPKYFQPRAFVHVEHIPLTATGKPARKQAEALAQ